jgi:tRNA modification GTPase
MWLIQNKIDLRVTKSRVTTIDEYEFNCSVSAANGEGIEALVGNLAEFARGYFSAAESGIVTRARHHRALENTVAALDRALAEATDGGNREELIAEELRAAATTLGRLTGRVDVEDILDVIFRDFCIGK